MRALKQDEIDYLSDPYSLYDDDVPHGLWRRLRGLGLVKVDVPRIPGYQRTLYVFSKKGEKLSQELMALRRFSENVAELKRLAEKVVKCSVDR
jgi:hypothetical protein